MIHIIPFGTLHLFLSLLEEIKHLDIRQNGKSYGVFAVLLVDFCWSRANAYLFFLLVSIT